MYLEKFGSWAHNPDLSCSWIVAYPGCLFFSRLRPTAEEVSAFGQHRNFPPHARKTSGTQGNSCPFSFGNWNYVLLLNSHEQLNFLLFYISRFYQIYAPLVRMDIFILRFTRETLIKICRYPEADYFAKLRMPNMFVYFRHINYTGRTPIMYFL